MGCGHGAGLWQMSNQKWINADANNYTSKVGKRYSIYNYFLYLPGHSL